ncbi:TPA: acyltransferase, partial [Klebsiella pneumoniae]|nr:acyltransferase [Klebsiella pneumoniae]HBY0592732.1 acyltransferase [Klebsiella pneumoniae]HBY0626681.1 acyltransferase [Klebsiella pneumoniae]HBY0734714.1 acyltransferase [Klebsiella pneumoniae]HBY0809268.1 acyltransferase [Klebsiella pneumoniae]
KLFHIENWYFNIISGTVAGIILPLLFYHFALRLKMSFFFVYPYVKTPSNLK